MSKYELTNKAVEDLTGIWEYTIEKWSEQQADRYYNLLLDSIFPQYRDLELFGVGGCRQPWPGSPYQRAK